MPPEWDRSPVIVVDLDWRSVVWMLVALVALGFVVTVLGIATPVVLLVVVATFVALALDPIVTTLERRGERTGWPSRGWAVGIVAAVAFLAVGLFAAFAGPELVRQTRALSVDLPRTAESMTDLPLVGGWLRNADAPSQVSEFIDSIPKKIQATDANLSAVAEGFGLGLGVVVLLLVLIGGVLFDGPRLIGIVRQAVPANHRQRLDSFGRIVYEVIARYFAGSLLIALINGVWVTISALVARVPLAPVLGLWAAVTSLIPQIGGLLGFALVALVSLTAGLVPAIIMCLSFLVIMLVTNHALQPLIVGRAVSLSAPTTMLATIVGLTVASIPGALFAVPIAGAVKAVVQHLRGIDPAPRPEGTGLLDRLRRHRHSGEEPDPDGDPDGDSDRSAAKLR
ncbi:MAG: AI-2E family transporter [Actinobacteria bacterium]|nr:AI-2E family transporter [Actinomycetota bacterium]